MRSKRDGGRWREAASERANEKISTRYSRALATFDIVFNKRDKLLSLLLCFFVVAVVVGFALKSHQEISAVR